MDEISQVWLDAADAALSLVERPRVGERWADSSSLPGMTVGALAGHLVQSGVLQAGNGLVVGEPPVGAPIPAAKLYSWKPLDVASPVHETVRSLAASQVVEGREDLIQRGRASWRQSGALLAEVSLSRVVAHPVTPTLPMTLGEYLRTRILELVVHVDDLAHSVGVDDPPIDRRAIDLTCQLGIEIDVERYGSPAVLRALFRRDRSSLDALRTF